MNCMHMVKSPHSCCTGLSTLIGACREGQAARSQAEVGSVHVVLVEGLSKRSPHKLQGRTCTMKRTVFEDVPVPASGLEWQGARHATGGSSFSCSSLNPGDYVAVKIHDAGASTLMGTALHRTTLTDFVDSAGASCIPAQLVPLSAYATQSEATPQLRHMYQTDHELTGTAWAI